MSNPSSISSSTETAITSAPGATSPLPSWAWAAVPALALGALSLALAGAPLPQPISAPGAVSSASTNVVSASSDWVVPASETLVVSRQTSSGHVLLQGRLAAATGTTMVAARSGQIAQVLVRTGQAVRAGQEVLLLSRGVASRADDLPAMRTGPSRAERSQVAAVRQGEVLQGRVQSAQQELDAAQQRLEKARSRWAAARELVNRLQKGEEVNAAGWDSADARSPADETRAAQPRRSQSKPRPTAGDKVARDRALRDSQRLQAQADGAASKASAARRAADAAESIARSKQAQADDARAAAKSAASERKAADPTPASTPGDGDGDKSDKKEAPPVREDSGAAREAQSRANAAQSAADSAKSRAASLRREAESARTRAADLRGKANDAVRRAAATLQSLQIFDGDNASNDTVSTPRVAATPPSGNRSGNRMTVRDAARIVRAASAEVEQAEADVNRVLSAAKEYQRPVTRTAERVETTKRRFDIEQQQVWSVAQTVRPNVTYLASPAAGVVLWVASPAREVQAGEAVAGIGRADRLVVSLQDRSGVWKTVRAGSQVLALVQPERAAQPQPASAPNPMSRISTSRPSMRGVPTLARVLFIRPPARPGAPAVLQVAVHNPRRQNGTAANANQNYGLSERMFVPGTPILCSLSQPGARTQLAVPTAAIRRDDNGNAFVAVLAPVAETAADMRADLCRVEWRQVEVGRGDGFQNVISSGLKLGDRIALRPDAIYNFTVAHGTQATLRVEQA